MTERPVAINVLGTLLPYPPSDPAVPGTTFRVSVRSADAEPVHYSSIWWTEVEARVRRLLAEHGVEFDLPPDHDVPEGLTPKGDGTFYGEYRHVPDGWEVTCWAKSPTIVKDGVTGFSPDAIVRCWPVRCWPSKPKWEADGMHVRLSNSLRIVCYRHTFGEGGAPELAERVARLLNEDDQ